MQFLVPFIRRAAGACAVAALWVCLGWACTGSGTGSESDLGADASVCPPHCEANDGGDGRRDAGGDGVRDAGGDPLADGGCVGTSSKGQKRALDMYLMLDQSGSMNDKLASGDRKWAAVTGAIRSFLAQPGMEGVSVGLQYFPLPDNRSCPSFQVCLKDSDCTCGPCELFVCAGGGGDSCDPKVYAAADVEIDSIASAASSIRDSIDRHGPGGDTPTSAALKGAIDHAQAWTSDPARANHVVIVVLATDGQPTECDVSLANINGIAAAGASASPKIRTFVIGVGSSLANLNGIAESGGTTAAFVVDTAADVGAQFLEALNRIRGSAVACSYTIPNPPDGQQVAFDHVNVRYTPGSGASSVNLAQVRDSTACAGKSSAWYYDDRDQPKQILLCPNTCSTVESDANGGVDVVLGCETKIDGPN